MDLSTKNTARELEQYDDRTTELIERTLSELGLVVSGWSGQYDPWLRQRLKAMSKSSYPLYWSYRSSVAEDVSALLEALGAIRLKVRDADTLFNSLDSHVSTLERLAQGRSISTAQLLGTARRFLADERTVDRFEDLLRDELRGLVGMLNPAPEGTHFPQKLSTPAVSGVSYLTQIELLTERLRAQMIAGGAWGRPDRSHVLADSIAQLAQDPNLGSGSTGWRRGLAHYPAVLALYAAGIAAIGAKNYANLAAVLVDPVIHNGWGASEPLPALLRIVPYEAAALHEWQPEVSAQRSSDPASERISNLLEPEMASLVVQSADFKLWFNRFEVLKALVNRVHSAENGHIEFDESGRLLGRQWRRNDELARAVSDILHEAKRQGLSWGPLRAGIFKSVEAVDEAAKKLLSDQP